jgi:hypothetical protein
VTSYTDYLHNEGFYGHALLAEAMERTEAMVRHRLRERGYGLMHRRKGQFWVVLDKPMTLEEIDQLRDMLPAVPRPGQATSAAVIEMGKEIKLGRAV